MNILLSVPAGNVFNTFFTPKAKEALNSLGKLIENPYPRQLNPDEFSSLGFDAKVLITGWGSPVIDEKILDSMPNLEIIAHCAGSVAPIYSEAIHERGIRLLSGNTVFAKSVAEGALCYILCSLRRIENYTNIVREGKWREDDFYNRGLIGKTVGLIGFGAVAKELAALLKLFDCELFVYDKFCSDEIIKEYGAKKSTPEEIFSSCDIISLHLPKTPETEKIITEKLLFSMRDGALFVNTARGALVDEDALIRLLQTRNVYAVSDVFTKEPLDADSPLRKLKNCLPVPHMAGPTIDMREQVVLSLCRDIRKILQGKEKVKSEISREYALRMTR